MIRVLVVDDKPENLYLLRVLLQGHGCTVDEARHGAEALVRARQTPPQLIISDLLMPVMDGYTLLRHWKADERLKAIPFVVYTATYTEPKDERLALDLGADAFIVKPAEPEPFMARIGEVLKKHERGELAPTHEPHGEEKVQLKEYSEILIRKLEEKALQLEQTNRALHEDIARRQDADAEVKRLLAEAERGRAALLSILEDERAAREELRESEERQRIFAELTSDYVYVYRVDPDGRPTLDWTTDAFTRIMGYTVEEYRALPSAFDIVHPEDQLLFKETYARILAGEATVIESRAVTKQGAVRWMRVYNRPIWGADHTRVVAIYGAAQDITERKRAEDERDRLFYFSIDMLCVAGLDGYFKQLNPAWSRTFGWSDAELLNKPWIEFVHTDQRAATNLALEQLKLGRPALGFENRYVCRDGSYRWISWNAYPLPEEQLAFAVARDVTEAKQAEEELRLAFEAARVGAYSLDLVNDVSRCSKELEAIYGVRPGQLNGKGIKAWEACVVPEDLPQARADMQRALEQGDATSTAFRIRRGDDGEIRWMEARGRVDYDADHRPLRIFGVNIDITERKRAEQMVRASEERYRTLVEQAGDAILLSGPDRCCLEANRRAAEMFGHAHDELIGLSIAELVYEADRPRQAEEFRAAQGGGQVLSERRFRRRDGSEFAGEINVCRLPDGRVLGIVRDISERKRAEQALRESNERLQTLSRRMVEVQEDERRHLARELHDEIGQLLTSVNLGLHSLKSVAGPDAEARLKYCLSLVDVAMQKVRGLSLDLRPSMLDMFGLDSALRWLAERVGEQLELTVQLAAALNGERLPTAVETACFRIVQEALTNVTRHARARTATVRLDRGEDEVRVTIQDDGVGFDVAALQERVGQGKSFGVLSMRERVELLGGRFEIDSAPGRGTTIRAHVPLKT